MTSALTLTFHRIQQETIFHKLTHDPASERYIVSAKRFEETVGEISTKTSCTVSEFVNKTEGEWFILTFDDGFISDFEIVFPALLHKGLKGTFFITAEKVGHPGYTTVKHLQKMAEAGMEIGSHGLTHRYLVTMSRADAFREILESKKRLEQAIGVKVTSFAPVGGHFHKWMIDVAREGGFKVFAAMIPGRTYNNSKDILLLRRNHIQTHHDMTYVSSLLRGHKRTLLFDSLKYILLSISKGMLGMRNYDWFKGEIQKIFGAS